MTKYILHIVRHGQYLTTTAPPYEPDGRLTDLGREQARLIGTRLTMWPIKVIHHSTTHRAVETAQVIARNFPNAPLIPSDLLRECIPCVPDHLRDFFAHLPSEFIEKGHTQARDSYQRYFSLPENVMKGEESAGSASEHHELIVAHGNLISFWLTQLFDAPCEAWVRVSVNHCSLTQVELTPVTAKLIVHNDVSHLPESLRLFK
jgi:probable phosphoglycerate mutase